MKASVTDYFFTFCALFGSAWIFIIVMLVLLNCENESVCETRYDDDVYSGSAVILIIVLSISTQ